MPNIEFRRLSVGRWSWTSARDLSGLAVFFTMRRTRSRLFVVATFAMTADGKITTQNFGPVDFTSREDKLHLFRQRALADAVLIGHTSLERDNVRLGLPQEMAGTKDQARPIPFSASRDCLEQRQNRRSTENLSLRHCADHHFFHDTDAAKNRDALGKRRHCT